MGETEGQDLELAFFLLSGGILGMLLLAAGIITFFVLYQRRLLEQRDQIRQQELDYQQELLSASLAAEESERKRIANDLHDSVGSLLSTTKLFLNRLQLGADPTDYLAQKKETTELLDHTIVNIRNIVRNIAPPSLEQFGLIAALQDLCKRIHNSGGIQVHFQYNRNQRLTPEQEVAIFRVLQELINNTIKHAEANSIYVRVFFSINQIVLEYEDDGKGFQKIDQSSKGLGLRSIESRIININGNIDFKSTNNKGTHVKITLKNI